MVDLKLEDQPFPMTEAAYLEFEAQNERMHEFVDGIVYPRIGVSIRHGSIRMNSGVMLHTSVTGKPDIFVGFMMRVKIPSKTSYRYPDVVVVLGKVQLYNNRDDTITNPIVLIEVLSPETAVVDLNEKFDEYIQIDSLKEYIIIAQDEPKVRHYLRQDSGDWLCKQVKDLDATLELPSIGCTLALSEIYRQIEFEDKTMDKSYIAENDAERERLKALVARLTDEELTRPMDAGWTVAGVLAHLAFWDARALYFMNKWEGGIAPSQADWEPEEIDWINDSAKPLCLALPPRTAAQLATQMAEDADKRVAALSDALLEQIHAIGQPFNLSRASHRKEHLDDIGRYL
jgi:Uma2 family endonuclease